MFLLARRKKKRASGYRKHFTVKKKGRVLSTKLVFGDIDPDSELVIEVDTERRGVVRGGRGRSV